MNLTGLYREKTISRWAKVYKASYFSRDNVWLICVKPVKNMPQYMSQIGIPLSVQSLDLLMHKKGSWKKYLIMIDEKSIDYIMKDHSPDSYMWFKTEQDCLNAIEIYVTCKYDSRMSQNIE